MRHPPRSGLLLVAAAVALVGTAVAPVVTAAAAAPARTVEYSVTSRWGTGFQGAVEITNKQAALSEFACVQGHGIWDGPVDDASAVVFDLFNEPCPDRATSTATQAWTCWRDGGTCPGLAYEVAGMQDLIDAVRGTGAKNVILAGGLAYSNDLSQWPTYRPNDPTGNLAAAWLRDHLRSVNG
ncbi:cellulase family glycosylhydrolase [Streptomyces bluensis]|uniref:cellulase family glycosylhydrolase n=1 Tax=Streptomyces bluensis TaxID=33897 RepID=UPI0036B9542E